MVEEFEEVLGWPLGGRKPYLFSGFYPSLARISKKVQISAQELDHRKQVENGVVGISRKYLEAKARILAGKGEWVPFLSLIHISEPTRPLYISYAVFCLKKQKDRQHKQIT